MPTPPPAAAAARGLPALVVVAAVALCCGAPRGAVAAPRYEVHLLTMSPGEHPFERFGHTALGVKDRVGKSELVYNFGTFDFDDPELWRKAVDKRLGYWVSAMNPGVVAMRYASREIRSQELALSEAQAEHLVRRLGEIVGRERRTFDYDLFENNCVTRVRDLLDEVTGGALRRAQAGPAPRSFREEVLQTLRPVPSLQLTAQVVYGPYTDRPRSRFETLFLSPLLHDALAELTLEDDGGARRPLVRRESVWRDEEFRPPGPLLDPALVLAVGLLALLGLLAYGRRQGLAAAARAGLCSTLALLSMGAGAWGLLLLYGGATPHAWFQGNGNRLLLSPLDLALAPLFLLAAGRPLGRRAGRALLLLLAAGAALSAWHLVAGHGAGRCAQVHGALLPGILSLRLLLLGVVAGRLLLRGAPTAQEAPAL